MKQLLASTAVATSFLSDPIHAPGQSVLLGVDLTALSATNVVVSIHGYDNIAGETWLLLESEELVAPGFTTLAVGTELEAVANVAANASVPLLIKISAVCTGGAATCTFSVNSEL